jgi:3-hydroxyisobutyrate dehydrogenase
MLPSQEVKCKKSKIPLGVGGAEKGTLTFMVGGEKDAFEKGKIILQMMGKNIVHCGGAGNGQVAKLCNNLLLGISMIGISISNFLSNRCI